MADENVSTFHEMTLNHWVFIFGPLKAENDAKERRKEGREKDDMTLRFYIGDFELFNAKNKNK